MLPFSGAVFCHAYTTMKSPAWLEAHARGFSTFGVTQIVVPDNPPEILDGPRRLVANGSEAAFSPHQTPPTTYWLASSNHT